MTFTVPRGALVPGLQSYLLSKDADFRRYEKDARKRIPQLIPSLDGILAEGLEWERAARARRGRDTSGSSTASLSARLSTSEAARQFGIPRSTLQHALQAGRLRGEKPADRWLLDPVDVETYAAGRRAA